MSSTTTGLSLGAKVKLFLFVAALLAAGAVFAPRLGPLLTDPDDRRRRFRVEGVGPEFYVDLIIRSSLSGRRRLENPETVFEASYGNLVFVENYEAMTIEFNVVPKLPLAGPTKFGCGIFDGITGGKAGPNATKTLVFRPGVAARDAYVPCTVTVHPIPK